MLTYVNMILEYIRIWYWTWYCLLNHTSSFVFQAHDAHQAVQVTGVQVRVGVSEEIPDELPEEIPDEFETPQVTCIVSAVLFELQDYESGRFLLAAVKGFEAFTTWISQSQGKRLAAASHF